MRAFCLSTSQYHLLYMCLVQHTFFGREICLCLFIWAGTSYPDLLLGPPALPSAITWVSACFIAVLVLLAAWLVGTLLLLFGLIAFTCSTLPLMHTDLLDCVLVDGAFFNSDVAGIEVAELLIKISIIECF